MKLWLCKIPSREQARRGNLGKSPGRWQKWYPKTLLNTNEKVLFNLKLKTL